ncbi:thermonuclease family protein [Halomonas sp. V046]|uniref:thermonuclease family protein n=1 Tax=Halomonas sp. V046 TaxID=3459611 RepID=UPI0040447C37
MAVAPVAVFLGVLLTAVTAQAHAGYGSATVARVTSIVDGDTFRADIDGWPAVIGERIPVRIEGINTPEMRSRCPTPEQQEREKALAREAKQFTVAALRDAERIQLHEIERGSFFRILARVTVDGHDLGDQLIEAGLARPYRPGASKTQWCQ